MAVSQKSPITPMRYRLRTLLIVLAVGPMVLAGAWVIATAILRARDIAVLEAAIANYRRAPGDYPPYKRP